VYTALPIDGPATTDAALAALAAEVGLLDCPEDKAAAGEGEKKAEEAVSESAPAAPTPVTDQTPQPAAETPVAEPEDKKPIVEKTDEKQDEPVKEPVVENTVIKVEPMEVDPPKEDESKSEEAKQDAIDDPLATLASAAVSTANGLAKSDDKQDDPKKDLPLSPVKKEIVWFDVCLTKSTSALVQNYGLPDDDSKFRFNDQTGEVINFAIRGKKHDLLPGTAYKFRVAAVNSCGQGGWSEVVFCSTCFFRRC